MVSCSCPWSSTTAITFGLAPIALFLLMGEILLQTGVAFKAIGAIDRLISRVPGRLSVVSIVGGTVFSSLSGSTIANTAILGSVLLPDMIKRGYQPSIAMGPIMAVGGIAMLIPPSALAVLLASIAEQSVAQLLIAGIIPGFLMAMLFFAYVIIRCTLNPSLAPSYAPDESALELPITVALNRKGRAIASWTYRGPGLKLLNRILPFVLYILPLFIIFIVVVGSIFYKIAAPTEAAALGSLAAFGACYFFRLFKNIITITGIDGADFTWRAIAKALMETAKVNTMILFIIAGSLVFAQALSNSGATDGLLTAIASLDLTRLQVVIMMMLVLLFLGAFMDQVSMLLLTLPFFLLGRTVVAGGVRDRCCLADGADADHHGNQPSHAAIRPAALRDEGYRALRCIHRACDPVGHAVHPDRAVRARAAHCHAGGRGLAAEQDRLIPVLKQLWRRSCASLHRCRMGPRL